MTAYYNENDRHKAAWLRNLIEEGEIAHGVVDERSIHAVQPDDLKGFAQCHFFAGIGLWSLCLRRAGWDDDRPVWTGSCPCGPFSVAGLQKGFDDPRHLWPEWFRLISICRPGVLFGEQSADAVEWLDLVSSDLESVGYAFGPTDIPASGFGGAHRRQRFGFVADTDNAEWWSERAPWHDGRWPKTGWVESYRDLGDGGAGCGLADPDSDGRKSWTGRRSVRAEHDAQHGGGFGRMAYANSIVGLQGRPDARGCSSGGHAALRPRLGGHGQLDGLGDPFASRLSDAELGIVRRSGWWPEGRATEQSGDSSRTSLDWLFCRDSKWRPVEPLTCPLVDESPARMGRLRGYGDAIDVEAFTNLIAAYLDIAPGPNSQFSLLEGREAA